MATHFLNNIRINDEYTLPSTDGTDKQIIVTDGAGVLSFDDLGTVTQSVTGVQSNFTYYEVKNSSGAAIPEFTGVMAVGTDGNSGHILIDEMVADGSVEPRYFLGVTQDGGIANGAIGRVVAFGEIDQINTNGFSNGDVLWCDPSTAGGFTTTEPDGPNLKIPAAIVVNAATNGKIQVRVQANEGIHTLHDTAISSQANGDLLQWNSSTGVWENKQPSSAGLMTSFSLEADSGNQAISNGEKVIITGGFGIATTLTTPVVSKNEVTIDLARGLTTVTKALNTFAINLSSGENFLLNASGTYYITLTIASSNVGQSGTIVINNTAATSAQALPSYMLTPEGATLDWVNTSGAVSIISYFVLATDKVLCNYVGNFQ